MSRSEQVIRTSGKPPTFVQPREEGGWLIRQGKYNSIRLADDETDILIDILTGDR